MIKDGLANVGIGAAKLDLIVPDSIRAGEKVQLVAKIKGGKVEQRIEKIYLELSAEAYSRRDGKTFAIVQTDIIEKEFIIKPQEEKEIVIDYLVNENCPITLGATKLFLLSSLNVKRSLDPRDRDGIIILPGENILAVARVLVREFDFIEAPISGGYDGVVQKFRYEAGEEFKKRLDDKDTFDFTFMNKPGGLELTVWVEKGQKKLSKALSETFIQESVAYHRETITITREVLAEREKLAEAVKSLLEKVLLGNFERILKTTQ